MIHARVRTEPHARGLAEIVIDRPDKRNALTPAMLDEMSRGAEQLIGNSSARAIVVRGEGETFCAGFDLTLCKDNSSALEAMLRGLSRVVRVLRRSPKPIVVAVQGAAIAGGCALLGAADLVVADRAAKFGYPVVKLGISPAVNAPLLKAAVGARAARHRSLDPGLFDAEEAKRIGLVHMIVDLPEDAIPRAELEAIKLGENPPDAYAATKAWLNEIEGSDEDAVFERALEASLALVGSPEERERLKAVWGRGS